MNEHNIDDLLNRAYETDDWDETERLVKQALKLCPDHPEALLLQADLTEDDEEKLPILQKALASAQRYLEEQEIEKDDILEDDAGIVYLALLQRTAFTLFALSDYEGAMKLVEELMEYDHEELAGVTRALFYRILLEQSAWAQVLEETMQDINRDLAWAYARTIATFMLSREKGPENAATLLWDAMRMAPNVPFYMLGYFPEPVEESDEEDFHIALLFEGIWSVSRELLNWFSRATILFGLLSNRFGDETEDMKEILDALSGLREYQEFEKRLEATKLNDEEILSLLSAEHALRTR